MIRTKKGNVKRGLTAKSGGYVLQLPFSGVGRASQFAWRRRGLGIVSALGLAPMAFGHR